MEDNDLWSRFSCNKVNKNLLLLTNIRNCIHLNYFGYNSIFLMGSIWHPWTVRMCFVAYKLIFSTSKYPWPRKTYMATNGGYKMKSHTQNIFVNTVRVIVKIVFCYGLRFFPPQLCCHRRTTLMILLVFICTSENIYFFQEYHLHS